MKHWNPFIFISFLLTAFLPAVFIASCNEAKREIAKGVARQITVTPRSTGITTSMISIVDDQGFAIAVRDNATGHWEMRDVLTSTNNAALDILVEDLIKARSEAALIKLQLEQCRAANSRNLELLKQVDSTRSR